MHKRDITACGLDAGGKVIGEVRRMPVSLEVLSIFAAPFHTPVAIAMEATLYWQWLYDQLESAGYSVRVADARQVKLIWQVRSKTDPVDARKLGELLRVNLFPAIWIPDQDTRRRRQLLHSRAVLVRQRTKMKNRVHGLLTMENLLFPRSDLYGRAGLARLAAAPLSPALRSQANRLLCVHDVKALLEVEAGAPLSCWQDTAARGRIVSHSRRESSFQRQPITAGCRYMCQSP